jgi:hypothetical protein
VEDRQGERREKGWRAESEGEGVEDREGGRRGRGEGGRRGGGWGQGGQAKYHTEETACMKQQTKEDENVTAARR